MDYKKYLVDCGMRMFKSGLTVETWGNISIKDPETGLIYLTPSGMDYDIIKPDDIIVMDREMNIVEGERKPTIEYGMHVRIMNARGTVKCAEYALPGSDELADNVVSALGDGAACMMANHGAVCVGKDMDAAFRVCTVLEMTAKIYHKALAIGEPEVIDDEKVSFMSDFAANHYGQGK